MNPEPQRQHAIDLETHRARLRALRYLESIESAALRRPSCPYWYLEVSRVVGPPPDVFVSRLCRFPERIPEAHKYLRRFFRTLNDL